jgi:hypothetical protein
MTQPELAKELGISIATLHRFMNKNQLKWKQAGWFLIKELYESYYSLGDSPEEEMAKRKLKKDLDNKKKYAEVRQAVSAELKEVETIVNIPEEFFEITGSELERETRKNINDLKKMKITIQQMIAMTFDPHELVKLIDRHQKIIKDIDKLVNTLAKLTEDSTPKKSNLAMLLENYD